LIGLNSPLERVKGCVFLGRKEVFKNLKSNAKNALNHGIISPPHHYFKYSYKKNRFPNDYWREIISYFCVLVKELK